MQMIDHPYIAKLYEVYEGKSHLYLVMEYIKGGDLFGRVMNVKTFKIEEICFIIKQILVALEYLHQFGIFHRDVKLQNILLCSDDKFDIKLIDFGLADFYYKKEFVHNKCGTPGYIAPEILNDENYDTKIDIFSLGIIFYILYIFFLIISYSLD